MGRGEASSLSLSWSPPQSRHTPQKSRASLRRQWTPARARRPARRQTHRQHQRRGREISIVGNRPLSTAAAGSGRDFGQKKKSTAGEREPRRPRRIAGGRGSRIKAVGGADDHSRANNRRAEHERPRPHRREGHELAGGEGAAWMHGRKPLSQTSRGGGLIRNVLSGHVILGTRDSEVSNGETGNGQSESSCDGF